MVSVFEYALPTFSKRNTFMNIFFYCVCVCIYPVMDFFFRFYIQYRFVSIVYTVVHVWVTYFHKWKFCFVFYHWSYHSLDVECMWLHMFVYFYFIYVIAQMPQITTRPFTFNHSFHQCIKKNSLSHIQTRVLFIRFSHFFPFVTSATNCLCTFLLTTIVTLDVICLKTCELYLSCECFHAPSFSTILSFLFSCRFHSHFCLLLLL